MKSIIVNKGILASAITLILTNSAIASEPVSEFDQSLTLKLHNELRVADRPSACGDGDYDSDGNPNTTPIDRNCKSADVKAWVQGAMLDYETENLLPWLDIQAYGYTVQKLWSPSSATSRFYLDESSGTAESFSLFGGSLNFKPTDNVELKLGRFGVDMGHGTIDHAVPLLEYSSIRTMPYMREGAMLRYSPTENSHFYGAITNRFGGGYYTEMVDESVANGDKSERYFSAYVYDDSMKHFGLGMSYQDDVSVQAQINTDYAWINNDKSFIKLDGRAFYGSLIGYTKDAQPLGKDDSTYVVSGQITYAKGNMFANAGFGQVGSRIDAGGIDTDIGFPFDMSISRNYQNTTSFSTGAGYNFNKNWMAMLSLVKTDGDLNYHETTEVDGVGANLVIQHKFTQGSLKGVSTQLIVNKAMEKRTGVVNEDLDYYDINLDIKYTFNIM